MPVTKNPEILDRNAMRIFGCLHADAVELNGGLPTRTKKSAALQYATQRQGAFDRGIGWEITFPEWMKLWRDSGRWEQRGVGRGSYCMARHQDLGPYRVGNVSIQLCTINSGDGSNFRFARIRAHGGSLSVR